MNEHEAARLRAQAEAVEKQDRVLGQFARTLTEYLVALALAPAPADVPVEQEQEQEQAPQTQEEGATS